MESRTVSGWMLNYLLFWSESESHLFLEVYTSFVAENLISHWISICSPTFSSPLAVSWGHVINSRLPSRPEHLKAGTWPSSSLPGHMFQMAELQEASSTNESTHERATQESSRTYTGLHMSKRNKPLYVYEYKPPGFVNKAKFKVSSYSPIICKCCRTKCIHKTGKFSV